MNEKDTLYHVCLCMVRFKTAGGTILRKIRATFEKEMEPRGMQSTANILANANAQAGAAFLFLSIRQRCFLHPE